MAVVNCEAFRDLLTLELHVISVPSSRLLDVAASLPVRGSRRAPCNF